MLRATGSWLDCELPQETVELSVKPAAHGQELEAKPAGLPSGYAALLYLFDLR
jgi:hypothetical protein